LTTRTPGRHRAARRPITPLTPLSRAAARGISGAARRGALVVAGSGLAVSLLSVPADAAPVADNSPSTAELDILNKTSQGSVAEAVVVEAVNTAPAVQVAADSKFTLETGTIEVTPAPEPEPEPVVEEVVETAAAVEKAVPASAGGSEIVSIAMQYLGVPYVWAGATPAGFDCSGFTSYVYAQIGINLPHSSAEQRYAGTPVSQAEAQPGDLIWSPGHVAIYAGDGMQVEAPVPGQTVRYTEIWQNSPTFIRVG
jgi:cell wall-associated NlpC family hydrolase